MIAKKNIIIGLFIAVLIATSVFCFEYFPKNVFAIGIKVGNQNIGRNTQDEAEKKLKEKIEEFNKESIKFIFFAKDETIEKKATLEELGVIYDIKKSLKEPLSIGKKSFDKKSKKEKVGIFLNNLKEKISALSGNKKFPLYLEISEEKFDEFLAQNFGTFETLPKNAEIIFDEKNLDFNINEPSKGMLFDKEKIKNEIKLQAQFLEKVDIFLSLEEALPEVGKEDAISSAREAGEILEKSPFFLLANGKKFSIEKKELGYWFFSIPQKEEGEDFFSLALDENLVKNYLSGIAPSIETEAKNPILSYRNGSLKIISSPVNGRALNIEDSAKEIETGIFAKKKEINLIFNETEPQVTEEKIKDFKIEKLVGKGESDFVGSPKNRVHNIKVSSLKFNGHLIAPDETFSFNETLGDVGPSSGYLPELVIKNNKTVPEYGGGVCQVSTTMFRVAVYSGMEIIERKPHAFPVKYYNPQGFDATIYLPSPDFKFKNNTGGYILIQYRIEGTKLFFEFYGNDDGRKVVVKGPYQYDFKEDGSMKARLEEEVWKDGKIIYKKTFLSFYKSPNLFPVEKKKVE